MSAAPVAGLGRHQKTVVATIVLAALSYLGVAVYSGWQDVWSATIRIGAGGLLLALALSLTSYRIRSVRWSHYLTALGYPLQWRTNLKIYLAGFALTTTPGGRCGGVVFGIARRIVRPAGNLRGWAQGVVITGCIAIDMGTHPIGIIRPVGCQ